MTERAKRERKMIEKVKRKERGMVFPSIFFLAVRVGRKSIGSINNGDKDVGFFGLVGVNGTWR